MANRKAKRRVSRLRIFLTATLLAAICGAIDLALPLEDIFRGARAYLLQRPADQKIALVRIDDQTFDALSLDYSEKHDAELIRRLTAAGANRIFYDRVFVDVVDEQGSQDLVATLKAHPGKVYFGVLQTGTEVGGRRISGPNDRYLPYVGLTGLTGAMAPFGFSARLNYAETFRGRTYPSLASSIAKVAGDPDGSFRPDFSIQTRTIPSYRYLDIITKGADPREFAGKDVIVGPDSTRIPDQGHILGQGWVAGMYYHALGAQTLREGKPQDLTWVVPFMVAMALAAATLRSRSLRLAKRLYLLAAATAVIVPFILDRYMITASYLPAILLYTIVAYRSHSRKTLDRALDLNAESNRPNLRAMRADPRTKTQPIAALLIKNYERIRSAYPDLDANAFLDEVVHPIAVVDPVAEIYHEDNTLYWRLPSLGPALLNDHVDGLRNLIKTVRVGTLIIDLDVAIGVDNELDEPVDRRIRDAKIAAIQAAANSLPYAFTAAAAHADDQWQLSLMSELDHAIQGDGLSLVYQPQLDIKSNRIVAVEALVRWTHPERGPIAPDLFIKQAEASGRINELTFWVIRRGLGDMRPLVEMDPAFRLGINLSAKSLADEHLARAILALAAEQDFPVANLKFEITETATIGDSHAAMANIETLAAAGAGIAIDDYGTGNATLEYLRSIPFDELKIDRQFIENLTVTHRDALLVRSTIALAHELGHTVTAEGIEDALTLNMLAKMGCDRAQGFHIAKPLNLQDTTALVSLHRPRLKQNRARSS